MPALFKRYSLGDFGNAVYVDDASRDPNLTFLGGWQQSVQGGTWNNTISSAEDTNSAILFSFTGTAVAAIGAIPGERFSDSAYTIDGSFYATFPSYNSTNYLSNFTFFSVNSLTPGSHTLLINVTTYGDYYFDYIAYQPLPTTTPTPTPATNGGSTMLSESMPVNTVSMDSSASITSSSPFIMPNASIWPTTTSSSGKSSKSHVNLAIVIPVTIVGAIILFLILAALWRWKRRDRRPYVTVKMRFGSRSRESRIIDEPSYDARQLTQTAGGILSQPFATILAPRPSITPFTAQQPEGPRVVKRSNATKDGSRTNLVVSNLDDRSSVASPGSQVETEETGSAGSHGLTSELGGVVLHAEPNRLVTFDRPPTYATSAED